jgi:hypothetical protein
LIVAIVVSKRSLITQSTPKLRFNYVKLLMATVNKSNLVIKVSDQEIDSETFPLTNLDYTEDLLAS